MAPVFGEQSDGSSPRGALAGLRVLELGQLLSGPFAGSLLTSLGAQVLKIEPPTTGDPIRRWRKLDGDTSLWWRSLAHDKRCITADLRQVRGREIVWRLIREGVDMIIENFRPGRMEAWGMGPEDLWAVDPRIVVVRISGYGQDGPHADRPGFANVAEAVGGLRYTTGESDRPSVRAGFSLGDSLAGMQAALAALAAIYERDVGGSGRGQVVDCALVESVFSISESLLPEYDRLGHIRQPTGGALPGIVPSNTYPCRDGTLVLGANSDGLYQRLMVAIGRSDLADDPALRHNDGRTGQADRIDQAITAWTSGRSVAEALQELYRADIPCGPVNTIAEIAADPQCLARDLFHTVELPDGAPLRIPRVVPKLSRTPTRAHRAGPALGAHNDEVLSSLGYSDDEIVALQEDGII